MTGVKCLNCGHVMDRVETATYIGTTIVDRYLPAANRGSADNIQSCSHSAVDKALAGAGNGISIKCPSCGNTK